MFLVIILKSPSPFEQNKIFLHILHTKIFIKNLKFQEFFASLPEPSLNLKSTNKIEKKKNQY